MRPLKIHNTVTSEELELLFNRPKHKLFRDVILKALLGDDYLPPDVFLLVTSIDRNAFTGKLRTIADPTVSHYDSHACDYTFVKMTKDKYIPHLPIPLNRNKLMGDVFAHLIQSKSDINDMPLIALESDHIHTDDLRSGRLIYYREVRPLFDKNYAISKDIYKQSAAYDVII